MTSTRFLCFRRAFQRRWAIGWPNRFVEFIGQPVFVAVVVCLAFLTKEKEISLAAFSNPFFYFTGLYAFWVGLFGSCQSLNGEVQNGEWSYWTLGCRRNIPRHVGSIFGVNLACSLWTVAVFLGTIVSVAGILALRRGFNPFVSMFLTQSNSTADSLWQAGYILKPLLVAKWGSCGPLLFAIGLYGLSLLAATVCGVCFGMLLSTVFPDPSVSLQASVAFVVLLGMLSLLGLQGDKSRPGANNSALDRAFAPRLEARFAATTKTDDKAVDILVGFSRIMPQRYFFNVARMPFEKNIDKTVVVGISTNLDSKCCSDAEQENTWWRKDEGTLCDQGLRPWGIMLVADANPDDIEAVAKYIKADKQFEQKHRLDLYPKLLGKAVWMELTPLVWMCLVCLLIVNVLVLQLPQYRQLR